AATPALGSDVGGYPGSSRTDRRLRFLAQVLRELGRFAGCNQAGAAYDYRGAARVPRLVAWWKGNPLQQKRKRVSQNICDATAGRAAAVDLRELRRHPAKVDSRCSRDSVRSLQPAAWKIGSGRCVRPI